MQLCSPLYLSPAECTKEQNDLHGQTGPHSNYPIPMITVLSERQGSMLHGHTDRQHLTPL